MLGAASMADLLLFVLPGAFVVAALLLAFTIVTPSWRWVAGFIAVIAVMLTVLWTQHFIAASHPGYKEGPFGGFGILVVGAWTMSFAFGSIAYFVALAWWHSQDDA
jgi:hypothetical protein